MVSVKDHREWVEDNLTMGVLTKRFVLESKDSEYISIEYLSNVVLPRGDTTFSYVS